jgi:hypothetical protein
LQNPLLNFIAKRQGEALGGKNLNPDKLSQWQEYKMGQMG